MSRPRQRLPLAGLLLLLTPPGAVPAADDPPAVADVAPSAPVFQATLTDGTTATGRLAALALGGDGTALATLVGEDGRERRVGLDTLVKLTRAGINPPGLPEGSGLVLPEGDRLRAALGTADGATLKVRPHALAETEVAVPLDRVLGLVFEPPGDAAERARLVDQLRSEPRDGDVLLLGGARGGDRLVGAFGTLDDRTLTFEAGNAKSAVDRGGVVALGFDPTLIAYPKAAGPYLELTLADGSRLGVTACRFDGGQLEVQTRLGPVLRLPLKELAAVHPRGGSVVYLADREPAGTQFEPYLDRHPGRFGRDRTWDGLPLRQAGRAADHGLGMLPRSLIAYRIEPGDRRFQALVGPDDRAGDLSSVVFRVLVDKQERFVSPPLGRHDAPLAVDLDLAGGKVLILIVEFGERGDVQDSADWVEARIVR